MNIARVFLRIALAVYGFYHSIGNSLEDVILAHEQRKLSAILAADVVGYSRLISADESGTLAAPSSLFERLE